MAKVSIIGTGNLAWHLSEALFRCGHTLLEFCGRTAESTHILASRVDAQAIDHPSLMSNEADFIFLCVSDTAIAEVSRQLPEGNSVRIHCSGSTSIQVLHGTYSGVFYPLQSFRKSSTVRWNEIPVLVEGSTLEVTEALFHLASSLGCPTEAKTESDRQQIHLAAVLASNFVNILWQKAEELCLQAGLEPELLHPLMEETLNKAIQLGCAQAQTGPALRRDQNTMQKHLARLEAQAPWNSIYTLLSQEIALRHPPSNQP
jgi:predicted short-subunit dehydrogenase-like oxidoreductase (DUF2520 family)